MENNNTVEKLKNSTKDYKSYKVTIQDKTNALISEMEIAWTPKGETLMIMLLVFVLLLLFKSLMRKKDTYDIGGARTTTTTGVINYTYTYKK